MGGSEWHTLTNPYCSIILQNQASVPTSIQAASIMSDILKYLAEGFDMQHSHLHFASLVPVLYITTGLSLTRCQLYYYIC